MKVILSRKGFDSEFGGAPSPMVDQELIQSFPIPSIEGKPYKNLQYNHHWTISQVMKQLGVKPNQGKGLCHLDPDLNVLTQKRGRGWRGNFGQALAAQGHLRNQGVGEGDLFLFFGWFRKTEKIGSQYRYLNHEDFHMLFGYLLVDQVIEVREDTKIPKWLEDHPHCSKRLRKTKGNCIYIAKKDICPGIPGYGHFYASDKLILTKHGYSRSRWNLPKRIFQDTQISYHSDKSWKQDYFQSARKGQEFVIQDNKKVEKWALELIRDNRG